MKNNIFRIGLCLMIGFVLLKWFLNQPCIPPEKPSNVPKEAIWSGGCDGGDWIELVEIKDNKYRFRIYQDWNGEMKMDADFEFCNDTISFKFQDLQNIVCCYSHSLDSTVTLSVIENQSKTKEPYILHSIYPAHGGKDWEIIKEKYNIK